MKFFLIILFILFSNSILANDEVIEEVEVINLYETKSLDQMVLDNLKDKDEIVQVVESSNEPIEIESKDIEEEQIEIIKDNFIRKNNSKDLKNYFDKLQKINSKTLQIQIIEVLESIQFDFKVEQDKELFFLIVNYLQSVGQINKSYELIESYELNEDKN